MLMRNWIMTWASIVCCPLVLAAAAPASIATAGEVTTDMSQGAVTFRSGDNSLTLGGDIWIRWTGDDKEKFDADTSGSGVGKADGFSSSFSIPRVRPYIQGTMWRPWLRYRFEFELSSTSGEGSSKIKDGYLEVTRFPLLDVKAGQFKAPFSLQELTSPTRLEFVDTAITNLKYAVGRDVGVMLGGLTGKKRFGYSVGVFNGGGESRRQEDQGLLYVGRIWLDPLGEYKLSESPVDNPDTTILHAGLAARTGEAIRGTATPGVFQNPDNETAYNLELAWRYRRLFATGEDFRMVDAQKKPAQGPDIISTGWHAQLGAMVLARVWEIALRYAEIDPDRGMMHDKLSEARIATTYFWRGHNLKLMSDAGEIRYGSSFGSLPALAVRDLPPLAAPLGSRLGGLRRYTDWQYRMQFQLAF